LGLEGQTNAINAHAVSVGGTIIKTYVEVESGRNNERPQLAFAIAHAKRLKGTLLIAKLDRLARNIHFISGLMESKVDFLAVDNPCANKLTVHILACIAEHEAEMISQRTTTALAAARARGTPLGTHRPGHFTGTVEQHRKAAGIARKAAAAAHAAAADPLYSEVLPIIQQMREQHESFQAIADRLNADGFSTIRGAAWNKMQVSRLFDGAAA
jgi:DNA invertase Pin-like site-specific DNA recombinase